MSLKFKNPGEQVVRVSLLTGQGAEFPPGETVEVPDTMKAECLAANLTLVGEKKTATRATQTATVPTATAEGDDNESTVNAG